MLHRCVVENSSHASPINASNDTVAINYNTQCLVSYEGRVIAVSNVRKSRKGDVFEKPRFESVDRNRQNRTDGLTLPTTKSKTMDSQSSFEIRTWMHTLIIYF